MRGESRRGSSRAEKKMKGKESQGKMRTKGKERKGKSSRAQR